MTPTPRGWRGSSRNRKASCPRWSYRLPEVHALVAPHIDIRVARHTYVNAYRHLKGRHYDLVVILGINHNVQDGLFCVSSKNYQTPFGEIRTDRDFVEALKGSALPGTFATNDFGHKIEHSIEFQTVFLHHYLKGTPIVPILCGGIHEHLFAKQSPFEDGRFMGLVETIREQTTKRGKVLFVAGVDFSHVGLKFGDGIPADSILERAQANDRLVLDALLAGDGRAIYENAAANEGPVQGLRLARPRPAGGVDVGKAGDPARLPGLPGGGHLQRRHIRLSGLYGLSRKPQASSHKART